MNKVKILILSVFIVCLFSSCSKDSSHSQANNANQSNGKFGGIYNINILRGSPNALDPVLINSKHADDISSQIYDRLVDLDNDLKLVPELAKELPAISSDGLTYTFSLRTDVFFHDDKCFPNSKGRKMNAFDVKYSLTRCCDPRTRSVQFWAFQDKVVGATDYFNSINDKKKETDIAGFKVINDSTFQIQLTQPYSPFIYALVNSLGFIVPKEAVDMYKEDYFSHPVGTGPFEFERWKQNEEIVLKRNKNYWQKSSENEPLPYLDGIRYTFIKDDKVMFNNFTNGELSECWNIPTELFKTVVDANTMKLTEQFSSYELQTAPAMLSWFFDLNTTKVPFNNPDVRRAFNYAVDKEKIVKFVLENSPFSAANNGITPPVFPGYDTKGINGYSFDPKKGVELLTKAGYANGLNFPQIDLYIYPEPRLQQVAEAVQEMISKNLNVKINIKQVDFPQLMSQAEKGDLLFWGTRWYGDYPDPETYLNLLNGMLVPKSDTLPSYPNSTRYNNQEFNRIFNQAVKTSDEKARLELYKQAEQIAMNDAPIIPITYERHFRLLKKNVMDNKLDAMARYDLLKNVWLSK